MLAKLGAPVEEPANALEQAVPSVNGDKEYSSLGAPSVDPSTLGSIGGDPALLSTLGLGKTSQENTIDKRYADKDRLINGIYIRPDTPGS